MMGRGADGGCGTEERPCPVSRVPFSSFPPPHRCADVDLLAQARKVLSERSPFASQEEAARVPTLPVSLARHGDSRRRPSKKPHPGDVGNKSNAPALPAPSTLWDETEEYFRTVTLADLDLLALRLQLPLDPSFCIPPAPLQRNWTAEAEPAAGAPAAGELEDAEQEQEDMDIDEAEYAAAPRGTENEIFPTALAATRELVEADGGAPLNWLLGSRHRALLTTERPSKKRKLLGNDAGLARVLRLPIPGGEEPSPSCDYCCNQAMSQDSLLKCRSCGGMVHGRCYGVSVSSGGMWVCSWCKYLEDIGKPSSGDQETPCLLCPKKGGVLKPLQQDESCEKGMVRFAHLFCCLWAPELYVEQPEVMNPIISAGGIPDARRKLVCALCKTKHGVCVRCSYGACRTPFHPSCARDNKHKMEIWGKVGCDNVELRAFCARHSNIEDVQTSLHLKNDTAVVGASLSVDSVAAATSYTCNPLEADLSYITRDNDACQHKDTHFCIERSSGNERKFYADASGIDSTYGSLESWKDRNIGSGVLGDHHSNLSQFLIILKKLVEKGKVSIHDVESETGISASTLDSVMKGDSEKLSSEMQANLIKWLQDSVCFGDDSAEIPHGHGNGVEEASAFQFHSEQQCRETKVPGLLTGCDFPIVLPSCEELRNEKEGATTYIESDALDQVHAIETEPCPEFGHSQNDQWTKKFSYQEHLDASVWACVSPKLQASDFNRFYVHPWIKKRLIETGCIQRSLLNHCGGGNGEDLSKLGSGLASQMLNDEAVGETVLHKAIDVTELLPEDELEGEIISLQNKLIRVSLILKTGYENLIFKVVRRIPMELDVLKKQRWDMVLVNQYLREVREAKKRGRKERRHREAQAILAAATAAAASSRVLSHRKDAKAVIEEEHKPKVISTCFVSDSYPPQSRKEKPLKLSVPKLSSGKLSDANALSCDICRRPETLMKPIFVCGGCKVAVHLGCYRRGKDPISSWYCESCEWHSDFHGCMPSSLERREKSAFTRLCGFCGTTTGAFRKSSDGKWVHAFCAEWALGCKFRRGQEQLVEGVDAVLRSREILSCVICHQTTGICIKCCYGHCQTAFHPICARGFGLFMNLKNVGGNMQHKAYCEKHSQEQREKAEFHLAAEEAKNLRQTRVELEKLRLLCERIIKREKLKRELLVCSHGILTARRNYVANMSFARRPVLPSGLSAESATTSINNTSYSGTIDRSDDVTVDSVVSRKRKAIPPLHIRLDRTGEASIRANHPSIRVAMNRTSFSGKQLPQRPTPYASEEKRPSKSDKVPFQNQGSPRGFAYLPLESTSKSQDVDSSEPPQPDG